VKRTALLESVKPFKCRWRQVLTPTLISPVAPNDSGSFNHIIIIIVNAQSHHHHHHNQAISCLSLWIHTVLGGWGRDSIYTDVYSLVKNTCGFSTIIIIIIFHLSSPLFFPSFRTFFLFSLLSLLVLHVKREWISTAHRECEREGSEREKVQRVACDGMGCGWMVGFWIYTGESERISAAFASPLYLPFIRRRRRRRATRE
jgi:hypothetical protein